MVEKFLTNMMSRKSDICNRSEWNNKEYKYDDDSRMTSWKDENGNTVVKNTYDKEGRVVEQTDAEKGTATFKYGKSSTTTTDNEGNKTVYHYDDQYRTTSIEYPDGTTCEKTYNAENQLASKRQQPEQKLTLMIHLAM